MERRYLEELIGKYLGDRATEEEKQALLGWYRSSDYTRVEWPAVTPGEEEEVRLRMLGNLRRLYRQQSLPVTKVRGIWRSGAAIAAALIGVTLVLSVLYYMRSASVKYVAVDNLPGQLSEVRLPEGSRIWLNANSHLRYPEKFTTGRDVDLEGEAFFEIAPSRLPFVVHTKRLDTRVLGTSFNVRAYEKEKEASVAVATGKVSVSSTATKTSAVLLPGDEIAVDALSSNISRIKNGKGVSEWKNGELAFDLLSLEEISLRLENWYGYRFQFTDLSLRSYRYRARFKNTIPLKDLLSILCDVNNLRFVIDEKQRLVTLSHQ